MAPPRSAKRPGPQSSVFLNVPFDPQYQALFRALIFTIHDCGFAARCALESTDGGTVRVEKLYQIIEQCQYGIHDISRTTLDQVNKLPRFNMPLELGVFLGARRYGTPVHQKKNCLILDRDRFRYQKFCSDIAGQDIRAHGNKVSNAIAAVRDWLSDSRRTREKLIPGGRMIAERYAMFLDTLPEACRVNGLELANLTFIDYQTLVVGWLEVNRR